MEPRAPVLLLVVLGVALGLTGLLGFAGLIILGSLAFSVRFLALGKLNFVPVDIINRC